MTIFALPVSLAFVINLTLAIFVFLYNPHRLVNRLFGLFVFFFAIWNLGEFIMIISKVDAITLWGIRLILFGMFLSPAFFLHFSLIFPRRIRLPILEKLELIPIYTVPLFLFLISIWGTHIEIHRIPELDNICYYSFNIRSVLGLVRVSLIVAYSFLWYGWGVLNLTRALRKRVSAREQLKIKYLIIGVGLIFLIGILVGLSRLFFSTGKMFFFLGSSYTILISLFLGAAIFKVKLLNIRLLISKSLTYFIVTSLLLSVYILLIKNIAQMLAEAYGVTSSLIEGGLIVIFVFLLRPLEKVVSTFLDQFFFKEYFQMRERMSSFQRELLSCLDQTHLACKITDFLSKEIGFPKVMIVISDDQAMGRYRSACAVGWRKKVEFFESDPLIEWIRKKKALLGRDELLSLLPQKEREKPPFNHTALILPLIGEENVLGLVFLSFFPNQRKFSEDWLELLEIFASQISLAILRVQTIQKVQAKERELVQAEKLAALGRMIAIVSHEIRNPLGVIQTSAETLLEQPDHLTETQKEILTFILQETDRLTRILTDFLTFAKPQPIRRVPVELQTLVSRVFRMLEREAQQKGHVLRLEKSSRPIWVKGDPDQLYQALLNLGLNGLEAMSRGGELIIRLMPISKKWVALEVEDQGKGIAVEDQKRVFDPFFTTKEKGSGIGLAIVKRIIKEHGGNVEFDTNAEGTVFKIYLPLNENRLMNPKEME
ncbi:MAG: GHKL domain-containing protein [Calditrichaeota bacterium]|nr:GHKL domain-containing protein [Calditrichota bacterium]